MLMDVHPVLSYEEPVWCIQLVGVPRYAGHGKERWVAGNLLASSFVYKYNHVLGPAKILVVGS